MHTKINWVSGISLNQQILKLINYYECWKFIFIFSYLFPSTRILKFSQVNQGLLFPSYLDTTQMYWYLYTHHSSIATEALKMNSSNIQNFKTFNITKCLNTKPGATKYITESFPNKEIRQKPTKQKTPNKSLISTFTKAGFIKKCPVPSLVHTPNKVLHAYPSKELKICVSKN